MFLLLVQIRNALCFAPLWFLDFMLVNSHVLFGRDRVDVKENDRLIFFFQVNCIMTTHKIAFSWSGYLHVACRHVSLSESLFTNSHKKK